MNNITMNRLIELGIELDISAMPGMAHQGGSDKRGSVHIGSYDWSRCPAVAYRPDSGDYQKPSASGALIELPCTTFRSPVVSTLYRLRYRGRGSSGISAGGRTSVNITIHPRLFKPMIGQALRRPADGGAHYLVAYFHPDELLPKRGRFPKNNLYSTRHVIENINALLAASAKRNIQARFVTSDDMIDIFKREQVGAKDALHQ
jgi:hypothetical protein